MKNLIETKDTEFTALQQTLHSVQDNREENVILKGENQILVATMDSMVKDEKTYKETIENLENTIQKSE